MELPSLNYLMYLALRAGAMIKKMAKNPEKIRNKPDGTTELKIGVKVNEFIVKSFGRRFPWIAVFGEEGNGGDLSSEYQIICDPLCGSIPVECGLPIGAFGMCLVHNNEPLRGVIYDPFCGRLWTADTDRATYLWEKKPWWPLPLWKGPTNPSSHGKVKDSRLHLYEWGPAPYNMTRVIEEMQCRGGKWMCTVSFLLPVGLLASGFGDAIVIPFHSRCVEAHLAKLIIPKSTGRVTDFFGEPLVITPELTVNGLVASNGTCIHQEIIEIIRDCQ